MLCCSNADIGRGSCLLTIAMAVSTDNGLLLHLHTHARLRLCGLC